MESLNLLFVVAGLIAVHLIIAFAFPPGVALQILIGILVIIAALVVLLVLFRPSEGGGLAGAFGGMGSDNAFGVRAASMIDKVIAVIATLFLTNAVLIGILYASLHDPQAGGASFNAPVEAPAESESEPVARLVVFDAIEE